MPTAFLNPPASDPALTARTFTQNPTLSASLARLKTRGAHGINTGAEVPGGSDAAPDDASSRTMPNPTRMRDDASQPAPPLDVL